MAARAARAGGRGGSRRGRDDRASQPCSTPTSPTPSALLRGEVGANRALGTFWAYAETEEASALAAERTRRYTRLMSASQAMVAREVIRVRSRLADYRRILDVGGGDGTFLEAVARVAPARRPRRCSTFLPSRTEAEDAVFARSGLTDRSQSAIGGDFRRDPLPREGADLICLVRILHDHDDARSCELCSRSARTRARPRRQAAGRRADGGGAGGRKSRGRLFRLLPPGDGTGPCTLRRRTVGSPARGRLCRGSNGGRRRFRS